MSESLGTPAEADGHGIGLPYTVASLRHLLACGASPSPYSHEQIADWARLFWWRFTQADDAEPLRKWSDEMRRAADVALDVDVQWELFLASTYPLEQLQSMDFSQARLPAGWFEEWHSELG